MRMLGPLLRARATRSYSIATDFDQHTIDYSKTTGLFGNPQLTSPKNLRQFTEASLAKAETLSEDIKHNDLDSHESILKLDVLSDVICKVVDMAGFVRLSHPDPQMLQATTEAHNVMFEFMNELNTSRELYGVVCRALGDPSLGQQEKRVAEILKHDFEKTGIQFDAPADSNLFVQCSSVVSTLGQDFLDNIGPAQPYITLHQSQLQGFNSDLLKDLATFTGRVRLPLNHLAEMALSTVHDAQTRQAIWRALKTTSPQQMETLKHILVHRYGLAAASGYTSYASYELGDKLMKSPENVAAFLMSLQSTIWPKAKAEIAALANGSPQSQVMPWDHTYLLNKRNSARRGLVQDSSSIMSYFSLANVLQGISDVCEQLYGVRFELGPVLSGEVWAPDVRRLDVFQGAEKIGTIYCDLFSREGKSPNPAHFTIQCSREVWPWEESEYAAAQPSSDGTRHQLPIIALVCDFLVRDGRCLLTFNEVQTLFHEMGHAIHSMIGRTKLHNVAGTRCATDFVELPSILFEKFASEPKVLQMFARHYETGQPLPLELFRKVQSLNTSTEQWETYHQILLSLVDQVLHSEAAGASNFDMDATVRGLIQQYSIFPAVFSQQYAQFGHLISYGATYYSYLLDRCLANKVWSKLFERDPLDAASGHEFKRAVLEWGGSRPSIDCVNETLGEELNFTEVAQHL